jgi:hypothetical protein
MIEQRGIVQFLWAKDIAAKDIHKEMLPMYSEHCLSCHATLYNNIFRGNAFLMLTRLKDQCACGSDSNHKNSMLQVSRTCEMVGQVYGD